MEGNVFQIKTEVFEGPLDLLLQLIEKRKLFINDVSLAKVTDDYIDHVKAVDNFPMSSAAQFILIASTLLLLKSKSLLPTISLTEEEEESIEDLEKRLRLYKYFLGVSKSVQGIFGVNVIFAKKHTKVNDPLFSPQEGFTKNEALASIESVINHLPRKKRSKEVSVTKTVSLGDTIQSLTERMQQTLKMSFKEFAQHEKAEKIDVIIGFLAMLELVKQEIIEVNQTSHFEDIHMESRTPSLPQY
jgi:segregation and condensation protein A